MSGQIRLPTPPPQYSQRDQAELRRAIQTFLAGVQGLAGVSGGGGSAGALSDLTDVNLSGLASGKFLKYNGTLWVPANIAFSDIGSLPTTLAGYGVTDAVKNAGGTPSIAAGTHAARPAFGTAGRWYYETDTNGLFYDTGSAWVQFPDIPVENLTPSSRVTALLTTGTLADGSTEQGSLALDNTTNALVQISVDRSCWVRLYATQADRDDDTTRLLGTAGTAGTGLLAEFYFTGAGTIDVSPVAILANDEATPQYRIWYTVTNKSGSSHTVAVTMKLVPMDAPLATTQDWAGVTGAPTTLAGYGITDAYDKTAADGRYVKQTGDTMTGDLLFSADDAHDIGASGATRPRRGYFSSGLVVGTDPGGSATARIGGSYGLALAGAFTFGTKGGCSAYTTVVNTSTFVNIGPTSGGVKFAILRDDTNGGWALVMNEGSGTITIVASGGTTAFVVSGTPTATQIGLQAASNQIQAKGGSSRNNASVVTVFFYET